MDSEQQTDNSRQEPEQVLETQQPVSEGVPFPPLPTIEWSASEYVSHEKDMRWYLALFGLAGIIVLIVFLITQDYLACIVILLATAAISVYAKREPSARQYQIGEEGVVIDGKPYDYSEFRSFSVVEEGAIDSIWLRPMKRFSPLVVMYFDPEEEDNIVDIIANFLPHEDRELDPIDRLTRRLRF